MSASERDDLLARDARHLWHPFTQARTAGPPLPVVAAEGSWLILADGRRVFDGISSWWTNLHGHAHPRIAAAIAAQAARLDHVHFAGCTHPPAVEVAERLLALAPRGLSRVFFSDDGSTAVEVALKMALQYQAQRGGARRTGYIAFEHAYHGDTVGALSVGDASVFASPFGPLTFPVARAPTPTALRDGGADADDVERCLAALDALLARHAGQVAAVILEPMLQAAGGMRLHPADFVAGVARRTRAAGALFIADEVMTGLGRTGRPFAVDHAEMTPDLLCVAKGLSGGALPLAATLATAEVYDAFLADDPRQAFLHGHSYTANPIACAAAATSLALLDTQGTSERIEALAEVHGHRLAALARHPAVAAVRSLGTLGVVEIAAPAGTDARSYFAGAAREVAARMLSRGVLVRPLGPVVYLLPPYSTTKVELDRAYDVLRDSLDG